MEGAVPHSGRLSRGQALTIAANGRDLGTFPIVAGDFRLTVDLPPDLTGHFLALEIKSSRWAMPGRFTFRGDRRRLAYRFNGIRRLHESEQVPAAVEEALASK